MIYTELTNTAMQIAYRAHHGSFDKAGIPYIFHPIHLAEQMDDESSCCAALLHDVVEDTDITLDELAAIFPSDIITALQYLTHNPEEDYYNYLERIPENKIALKVKLADLAHNSDETRFSGANIPEETLHYFRLKYAKAKEFLKNNNGDVL